MKRSVRDSAPAGNVVPKMKIPKASQESRELLKSVLPQNDSITLRPLFGNIAAFVNRNMFTGLFGDDLFVRLSDQDIQQLVKTKTATFLSPMKGRPMKEYVVLPKAWIKDRNKLKVWISKSLDFAKTLPPKTSKKRR